MFLNSNQIYEFIRGKISMEQKEINGLCKLKKFDFSSIPKILTELFVIYKPNYYNFF